MADESGKRQVEAERRRPARSVRVFESLADAFGLAPGTRLAQAGLVEEGGGAPPAMKAARRSDARPTEAQREPRLAVDRGFVGDDAA
jgi:hypothetical protein